MPLHVSSTCARHQEVKTALRSLCYHHTHKCDNSTGCVMQFWPPDDEHICCNHVEAWNKLIVKQIFCASSWLITEIKIIKHVSDHGGSISAFPDSELHTHTHTSVTICCHNTDYVHINGHDRTIFGILAKYSTLMMDHLWSETCWSAFKYFVILIVSEYYILCISWTIEYLYVDDARRKYEDFFGSVSAVDCSGLQKVNVTARNL